MFFRRIDDHIKAIAYAWIIVAYIVLFAVIFLGCADPYGPFPWAPFEKTASKHGPKKGGNDGGPCPIPVIDTDEDGVEDDVDNCVGIFNPFQEDPDQDGIGSACDDDEGGGEEPTPTPEPTPEGTPSPTPIPEPGLSEEGVACGEAGKAWICHKPEGEEPHNVCVSIAASAAHEAHGDYEGDCQ